MADYCIFLKQNLKRLDDNLTFMQCWQKMMTDKEFNKLLEDDSQSDAEVGRRRRKRKIRDVVCNLFCCSSSY